MPGRGITRRDFLDGTRIALGAAALAPLAPLLARGASGTAEPVYPPALQGLRGSHPGSWETAHALVAGRSFAADASARREDFDLVVVGAGLSGLATAWLYRERRPDARILVLDNHDDFGGHAKRNEFRVDGRLLIGYGGTESLDGPSAYSAVAKRLLREVGVDLEVFHTAFDRGLYPSLGLSSAVFFDREGFGEDRLVPGFGSLAWPEFAARTPLSERARADLVRLNTERRDYLPGLSRDEKVAVLDRTSYRDFLQERAGVDPAVVALYSGIWLEYTGLPAESYPARWVSQDPQVPGLAGTLVESERPDDPYIFHFPDGNASVARLLVRSLVPAALPAKSAAEVLTARPRYELLDAPGAPVRIRLSSTAVDVRHAEGGDAVDLLGVRDGTVESLRARHCVLACWNAMVPYLCRELPEEQRRGLAWGVKAPLVYVNVALRRWHAFVRRGVHEIWAPGSFYTLVRLDFPVSLPGYRCARSPDEPVVVHAVHVPRHPELAGPEQWRAGRRDLLATSFSTFEERLRGQLSRMLGPDAVPEIRAITVNRWPHGYANAANTLWDPTGGPDEERPWEIGRRRHGRSAIANSDAAAVAWTDAAIDQAERAVSELLAADARAKDHAA